MLKEARESAAIVANQDTSSALALAEALKSQTPRGMGRIRRVLARYLFLFFNHSKATLALTSVAFFVTDAVPR